MARPTRNPAQRAADLALIARMLMANFPQTKMIEDLAKRYPSGWRMSSSQMSIEVKKVKAMMMEMATEAVADVRARRLAELRFAQGEYLEAWDKSKKDAERLTATMAEHQKKQTISKQGQCGNAAYLQGYLDAGKEIAAICGVVATQKHEVSGPGGEPVNAPVVTLILPRNGREVEELIEKAQAENAIAIDAQSADPESPVNGATETNGNGDGDNAQAPGL